MPVSLACMRCPCGTWLSAVGEMTVAERAAAALERADMLTRATGLGEDREAACRDKKRQKAKCVHDMWFSALTRGSNVHNGC